MNVQSLGGDAGADRNPVSAVPYPCGAPLAGLIPCLYCTMRPVTVTLPSPAGTDEQAFPVSKAAWNRLGASLGLAAILAIEAALVAVLMLFAKLPSKDALWIALSVTGVAIAAYSFVNGLRITPMLRRLFNIPTPN